MDKLKWNQLKSVNKRDYYMYDIHWEFWHLPTPFPMKALIDTLSSAGKHINGSPYQKSVYRREIFGLMIQEGSPALWITLSPAASHSPIFLQIAGYKVDLSRIPSHVERAKSVAKKQHRVFHIKGPCLRGHLCKNSCTVNARISALGAYSFWVL